MRWLGHLLSALGTAFVLMSGVTVAVQATGLGIAWSRGYLTADKSVRYAGVLYGLDPLDLTDPTPDPNADESGNGKAQMLQTRVKNTERLTERSSAITQMSDQIRGITLGLKRTREKYVVTRDGFESLLDQLEVETESRALREVQLTMEVIQPKQAKDLLRSMLAAQTGDPADDVMKDIVEIIKAMPDDKLKKILAEFKTEEERKLLHQVLVQIGDLDDRLTKTSRSGP